jgi:phosphoribosylanthranilate isomerase
MTKVKICGIKTLQDALAAAEAGAEMLGFNFYPKSVRFIDPEACKRISSALRRDHPSILLVGVFVNAALEEIQRALDECALDLAQLSGDESPETCEALRGRAFKAFHGIPDGDVRPYARSSAPAFMVDGAVSGAYGGTGSTVDWSRAAKLATHHPLLLAGGLKPENVAEAIMQAKPWGVDVASGVESRPGEKDAGRMKAFVDTVRAVEREAL